MTGPQGDHMIRRPTAPDLCDPSGAVLVPGEQRQRCEVISRICGYLRPIYVDGRPAWNAGKLSEWRDRKMFRVTEQAALPLQSPE